MKRWLVLQRLWRWIRWPMATAFALLVLAVLWGTAIEPRLLQVTRLEGSIPRLPASWHSRRVAFLGDLQIGMWLANTDTVRRAIAHLEAERPDAVVLLGDFCYEPKTPDELTAQLAALRRLLSPLQSIGVPVFAVLGNHDYAVSEPKEAPRAAVAEAVDATLGGLGIRVLHNAAATVMSREGEPLFIVGIGPHLAGKDVPRDAFSSVPESAARIVAMHNPNTFPSIAAQQAPLAVAGHTHGGQVRLPFMPHWTWLETIRSNVHADGWIAPSYGQPGNRLYVNRGIGFSRVPIRINCPPELTYFALEASD